MKTSVCAVICAAGKGERAGFSQNKLLVSLDGDCALVKTLRAFDFAEIDEILVTASKSDYKEISALISPFEKARVVLGGETRTRSVFNALRETQADIVLIHDGARPFVRQTTIKACIESVKTYGSGVCAVACSDTVAVRNGGAIESVPKRDTLVQIQTPQGFYRKQLLSAYEQALQEPDQTFTDDSSVFLRYCGNPRLCAGERDNVKLTYPEDFALAERCGFGVDTHAFGKPQDYIVLAGVQIPSQSGLIAHSDGDVLVHALMDALLSAAGLRDIGYYFPDTDDTWKDASSMRMLARVLAMLEERGLGVRNVSIAVQAEKPRLSGYIEDIKRALANALAIDPTAVGVSAGTNEKLGYVGEGKGITVNAYVLLKRIR